MVTKVLTAIYKVAFSIYFIALLFLVVVEKMQPTNTEVLIAITMLLITFNEEKKEHKETV